MIELVPVLVEKNIRLSAQHAQLLSRLAAMKSISEDELVAKALEVLFRLADFLNQEVDSPNWSFLSTDSLQRVWDNDEDAIYDNWSELHGRSTR